MFRSPSVCAPRLAVLLLLGGQGFSQDAIVVKTVKPVKSNVARVVEIAGEVRPFEQVMIRSKATGYAENIHVDVGAHVNKGDPLIELNIPEAAITRDLLAAQRNEARISIRIAEARIAEATATVSASEAKATAADARLGSQKVTTRFLLMTRDRFRELRKDGSVTDQQLEDAEKAHAEGQAALVSAQADMAVAHATVESAKKSRLRAQGERDKALEGEKIAASRLKHQETMMSYSKLSAPFEGHVVRRMVDTGDLVQGGLNSSNPTELFEIQRVDKLRIVVNLPEPEVRFVRKGTRARISGTGLEGEVEAQVTLVSRSLTRNRLMPIEIHTQDDRLLPGFGVWVKLEMEIHKNVWTVPSEALHFRKGKAWVWGADSGQARKYPVQVGFNDFIRAEIGGVDAGTEIIISSRKALKENMTVRPASPGDGK